jgi:hypothetical protein
MRIKITRHLIAEHEDQEVLISPSVSINFDKTEDASTVKLVEVCKWLEKQVSENFEKYRDATAAEVEEFED